MAPAAAEGDVDGTAFVPAIDVGEALPFDAEASVEAPPPAADALPARTGNVDETVAVGMKLDLDAVLPFNVDEAGPPKVEAGAPVPDAELTVDQYASLCAERDRAGPGGLSRVLERYRVADEGALAALDNRWIERLRDQATMRRFQQVRAQYRQWLASQG